MNSSGDRVGRLLHDWQKERSEWHGPTTLEVVREYAEWREALTSGDSVLGLREALKDARAGFEAVQDIFTAIRGRGSISVETQIERIDKALATQPVDTNEAPLLGELLSALETLCDSVEREEEVNGSISGALMSDVREARAKLEAIRNPSVEGMPR